MNDDIEVPRRGYDTKDVEAMSRALDTTKQSGSGTRRLIIVAVLLVSIGVAAWLIAFR